MRRENLLSVIVPIYNVEEYLRECLDSIVNQTYQNLEIILVNDGSPDSSEQICQEYVVKDQRVKYYKKENGGLSSARNYGLDRANGDYIAFVDSDDFLELDIYEKCFQKIKQKGLEPKEHFVVAFGVRRGVGNKENYDDYITYNRQLEITTPTEICNYLLRSTRNIVVWNKVFPKQLIENISFIEGIKMEDNAYTFEVLNNCKQLILLKDFGYYYRINPNSIISDTELNKKYILNDAFNSLSDLAQRGKLQKEFSKAIYSFLLVCLQIRIPYWIEERTKYPELDTVISSLKKNKRLYFSLKQEFKSILYLYLPRVNHYSLSFYSSILNLFRK